MSDTEPILTHEEVLEGVREVGREHREFFEVEFLGLLDLADYLGVTLIGDFGLGQLDGRYHLPAVECIDLQGWECRAGSSEEGDHEGVLGILPDDALFPGLQIDDPTGAVAVGILLDCILELGSLVFFLLGVIITGSVVVEVEHLVAVTCEEQEELVGQLSDGLGSEHVHRLVDSVERRVVVLTDNQGGLITEVHAGFEWSMLVEVAQLGRIGRCHTIGRAVVVLVGLGPQRIEAKLSLQAWAHTEDRLHCLVHLESARKEATDVLDRQDLDVDQGGGIEEERLPLAHLPETSLQAVYAFLLATDAKL